MNTNEQNILIHHGIKNQKWGVRRWQNEDGTLTEAGKEHYGVKNDAKRHESAWYKKISSDPNFTPGKDSVKKRASKSGKDLENKIAYKENSDYGQRSGLEDTTNRMTEITKRDYYDPVEVFGWEARSNSELDKLDADIKRIASLSGKVRDINKKDVSAGRAFINKIASFFKKIFK